MLEPGLTDAEMIMVVRAYNAAMSQPSQMTEAGGIALAADVVTRKITTHAGRLLTVTIDQTHFVVGTNEWAVELEPRWATQLLRHRFREPPLRFLLLTPDYPLDPSRMIESQLKLTIFSGDPIQFTKDLTLLRMFLPDA